MHYLLTKRVFRIIGIILVVLLLVTFFSPIVVIGTGKRGVVFNAFSGIENRVLGEGTHFRIPIVQSVVPVSVQVQKTSVKADAASKDLQDVQAEIVVNWHMDSSKVNRIYQQVGDEQAIIDRIIVPAVSEVVKAATAQKTASEILSKRAELKQNIDDFLTARLADYGVVLDDVSITDADFSQEFNKAIEQKQVAQQEAERAIFRAQEASATAQATINLARGEAEANRLKQQSLSDALLELRAIEKWDGQLPQVTGSGSTPFISIPNR